MTPFFVIGNFLLIPTGLALNSTRFHTQSFIPKGITFKHGKDNPFWV
jgi:hypothetical protein